MNTKISGTCPVTLPASAGEIVADLRQSIGLDGADRVADRRPFDHEADTRARLRQAAAQRWEHECPSIFKSTDWSHATLAQNRAAIDRVRAWQVANEKGLLITGPTGLGKSRAFWALLQRLMVEEGRDVRVFHSADFFRRMQEHINYGRDDSEHWLRAMVAVPILAIDDWGQEAVTSAREDWSQGVFMRLLDARLGERRPALITTNLTATDIAGGQSNAVRANPLLRRLLDLCEVVKFTL